MPSKPSLQDARCPRHPERGNVEVSEVRPRRVWPRLRGLSFAAQPARLRPLRRKAAREPSRAACAMNCRGCSGSIHPCFE